MYKIKNKGLCGKNKKLIHLSVASYRMHFQRKI